HRVFMPLAYCHSPAVVYVFRCANRLLKHWRSTNMKQIVLEQPGQFKCGEAVDPANPGPGEALVKIKRIGICGTDLHAYRGKQPFFSYPRRLGHELGVDVIAVGDNPHGIKEGSRCAVEPYLTCGKCIACRGGKTNCCMELKCLG